MQKPPPTRKDKFAVLKEYFGYTEFRSGQEAVIDAILAGKDALAVMPTGAGKSLCYQIPALLLDGLTVVISPLISLMKDQVNALREAGAPSACLNSSLSQEEYAATMKLLRQGDCKILYIAPERLLKENFLQIQQRMQSMSRDGEDSRKIALVVIDEAHCISQWGHDFRPSYLYIAEFIKTLDQRPVIAAFTATATLKVKEDILSILFLREPFVITTGFDRQNLYFEVRKPKSKSAALLDYVQRNRNKSGVVYCNTRKTVEEVWEMLSDRNFAVAKYHAGLEDTERHENQDDFLYDRKTIMVATNAFGMGIDKSNVSFVIHYNMPKNIESYYQEAGRAGRDGEPAECILFYSGRDVRINEFLITHSNEEGVPMDKALVRHNLELLKLMTWYATGTDCLRSRLLAYFGENAPAFCGNCSNCNTLFEEVDITIEAQKLVSCVLRLEQRGRRFGKTVVIDIVRGGKNEKIRNFHLDTLSTYGIMKDSSSHRVRLILDFLIEQGYLALNTGEFPVVISSERSGEIVFERKSVCMMLSKEAQSEKPSELSLPIQEFDEVLFEKLRDLRKTIAQKTGVPSYIVFSDAALRDMCRRKPVDKREFLQISGVGEIKMEKYGDMFTALIREYKEAVNYSGA
ncbi:MAG: DNA helicase RecQ [Treponema sp.]|jgi:ATP-dependent DNA helicase RecQ|nr:DNA helicase RecQ [Treponema sp.]